MIVAISGTPCTGKTSIANELGKVLGWPVFHLNDIAKEHNLYEGYDSSRNARIVDIDAINKEVIRLSKKNKNIIIESHYAHDVESDLVIILRTKPDVLRARMSEREWRKEKIEENVISEIMEVCKSEALENNRTVYVFDTTNRDIKESTKILKDVIESFVAMTESDVIIDDNYKKYFKKPFGELYKSINEIPAISDNKNILVSVGDVVSYNLINNDIYPDIIIIDGKAKRDKFNKKIEYGTNVIDVVNPPGVITDDMTKAIIHAFAIGSDVKIRVSGEEDLSVLPAIIFAPPNTIIIYGQPDEGVVVVNARPEKQKEARKILKKIISHKP